jgi:nitrogenase-stabilizing/protective protein
MSNLDRELAKLSSAEDFLRFFGISFDPHVVAVNRLHILKRCNQYLAANGDLAALDDDGKRRAYRDGLQRAYGDFVHSSAQKEKVFPIFRRGGPGFVALSALRGISRD